jgi:hypothetical protein
MIQGTPGPPDPVATAVGAALPTAPRRSGNRCGHDPRSPRWFAPPAQHKERPLILRKLQAAIRAYYDDPTLLPSLNRANGSDRQQRAERREGCCGLLGCLVHYLDLASLRVGLPAAGTFRGLAMPTLAALAGLTLRRAERAYRDLVAAGIVTTYPIAEQQASGDYRGLPAIRTLNHAVFKLFGLSQWLRHEREKAANRRRRAQRQQSEADHGRQELTLAAAARRSAANPPEPETSTPTSRRAHAQAAITQLRNLLRPRGPPSG